MDNTTFDTISRTVATSQSRRSVLSGLVAGAATLVVGGVLLQGEDVSAKRRGGKGKGKGKGKKLQPGQRCESNSQCTNGYICAVASNAGNSDKTCSGGQGAVCGAPNGDGDDTAPFCAVGFTCTTTGNRLTCQANPEE
jgi:hypothetical protein